MTWKARRFKFALVATNANYWTALGDSTRRTIFELLLEQPCSVSGLARALPVTRPAVSQHLKVLKEAGLVADTRSGKESIYRIDPGGLASLRAEVDQFWSKTLAGYKLVVEPPKKDQV
ncbi:MULTISPECIES: metalloregulator ArsR/SmtB family transcription factor [unclassified Mesorhizobium]|uniref:ArsR/SmtB family transcription factor n=1 Tax=Mesorhizobium TaxID=68287 RepID=UPI0009ED419F|nr:MULTISPECIES: metalloregulator ArsR/SmtB family transcription factor [unclassified Mesorhizobium]RUX71635.1 ArsR family transcriptional regulator [Mesorhizobium sp. M7A.F.Ca.US.005.03.1.1]RUY36987.1 ArsR family transcriptional regulator [Mesorhizobium sp. M7A.F.Ca.US.001.04.1.1]RUZ86498.1 ArsR family transcriptional regulator [Mesorhizobium sp. M7A.F.Ca.US.003.02.2.1]RVA08877.1 ArsR family transcriptional regulator [Mesorhizobium sp. M7A.F.Ca.US.002.01.1.1]RVA26318.1 ArsR family transcripti